MELSGLIYDGLDLRGRDFHGMDLSGASFKNANLEGANMRGCILKRVNFEGANLYCASLEGSVVSDIIYDGNTRYFEMPCPLEGAFIGYKKCFNFRIVQLLIPSGARRLSATSGACRCDMAKVLTIKSTDFKTEFSEAYSYFDETFVYRVKETVYADGFCEDRWNDSSQGIHFYMTRAEALRYL